MEGLTDLEFVAARSREVNGIEEQARRAGPAAGILRDLLRQERTTAEGLEVLERLRNRLTRGEVNAHVRERWPEPPLTAVIVSPSAEGFGADCVVGRSEEPEGCLPFP